MSDEKLEVDDYVRWLGKQKPIGLAWIGFAILQLAAAIFILTEAYVRYNEYAIKHEVDTRQILEAISERYRND